MIGIHPWFNIIRKLIPACALILSQPLAAAPKVDNEDLKQLRGRIETLQKELADTEESKSEVADALRESERAIIAANRKLAALTREHHDANNKLSQIQAQSKQVARDIEEQQLRLGKLLHRQYLTGGGQTEYLSLLLNQQDPNEIARNLHYYGYLSRARLGDINALRANVQRLGTLTRESREKSLEIGAIQAKQAEHKKYLEQEKTEHAKLLERISSQADQQRREISKLKRDEERLSRLVERIARMLAQKKRSAPRATTPGLLSNERLPDASADGSPFSSLKGRLSLPVRGELANRFGGPRADGGVTWKGLFIRSATGGDVKAIAGGRVVFADWLRGFGNLMIVDHGNSYMSLYGNNEINHKQVGDSVRGGDTIASVGNSGGNAEPGLYFELRHQGKPFDPLNWVRIK
ncbi:MULTISPECIES: murein hydrolase activator EnvC family protein [unclassified Nitrosospira]|uniref:murein hydrolase activator EnvC family protein n=1 Tax=unclassified Nitrosospira TaxID=2609267 RepID=UPI000D3261AC|nr:MULTISPECIES: peptidoglycan DD-metalloendopeptidase family protein [unclassified Nitrosospira]PTR16672.1 septal ring factor EnvC (AmiA/AmiB activator) [Nitrosospira sp. Nsp2]WON73309.1 peptidoglycan DD-metalloendopeptidase family protein [Nitrosospira sp. Is2]